MAHDDRGDERWDVIVHRNSAAGGTFYYSVKTTGVYCRPSCASRLPRRENVQFHPSCKDAECAGFRACKRCQPNGPTLVEQHTSLVTKACHTIATTDELPNLHALAEAADMSRFHFQRVFTKMSGLTPKACALAHRAERMRKAHPPTQHRDRSNLCGGL